jgi:hypothetical protein
MEIVIFAIALLATILYVLATQRREHQTDAWQKAPRRATMKEYRDYIAPHRPSGRL